MTQTVPDRSVASVDELKQAWTAVQAGDFSARPGTRRPPVEAVRRSPCYRWEPSPTETVVSVVGCGGSSGATSLAVAVAIATVAQRPARVVEFASVAASGLVAASTAELGRYERVWSRGTRGQVLLERVSDVLTSVGDIPHPAALDRPIELTVLDIGWDIGQVLGSPGWVADVVRHAPHLVLTTTATVPGMRRLEGALDSFAGADPCVAVLGTPRRKWTRSVSHTAGRAVRHLERDGALFAIPHDRRLASDGLTAADLPGPLLATARRLLRWLSNRDLTQGVSQ
ncbi:hypothetical protein [Allobranchiibius sp. GilTou38]|uniref:hypothetical protein n=1 Tax=Allobranchiibius sp. GilTou38 TaxID=2815210 RepID=UPI001AA1171E|nr:hypothetical protein [Allobranchiibius sp. GilTou38]MBO1766674.1 hypothetical protein [Allobranchiibius sp. GilTou38]